MIRFQAKYLPSLAHFMGSKDVRYWLNAIHIEPHPDGGAVLVATNGHMLMAIIDAEAVCPVPATFSVHPDAIKHCNKAREVHIHLEEQRLIVVDSLEQELYVQPRKCMVEMRDGHRFPDFRVVMPDFSKLKRTVASFINCTLLAKIIKAHPLNGKREGYPVIRFWQEPDEAQKPIIVQFDGAPECVAVLMPIAGKSYEQVPEEWMRMCRRPVADGASA
ncbi:MAG TPA: hypothetical protein VEC35_01210 [Noviherbaspirillum sp.]|nr:hypothetical protein [Noviherbaspirillum sp.]